MATSERVTTGRNPKQSKKSKAVAADGQYITRARMLMVPADDNRGYGGLRDRAGSQARARATEQRLRTMMHVIARALLAKQRAELAVVREDAVMKQIPDDIQRAAADILNTVFIAPEERRDYAPHSNRTVTLPGRTPCVVRAKLRASGATWKQAAPSLDSITKAIDQVVRDHGVPLGH
ncbi:hypothetical protein JJ685_24530 [Ramlibacter monticola]|uniref:Uncharacterized protein n=1 Tax=Ramlibacter monticola TaxID=1926872 RepID=A0A936Z3M9_9BURK|nr:hypothetical protein [Ramlibacter monticola]MBL0394329.1 hypothetical protein [Ramlibacter monticola]